jgi:hypothetical protein
MVLIKLKLIITYIKINIKRQKESNIVDGINKIKKNKKILKTRYKVNLKPIY